MAEKAIHAESPAYGRDPALEYARTILGQADSDLRIAYRSAIWRAAGKLSFRDVCELGRPAVEVFLDVVMAGEAV